MASQVFINLPVTDVARSTAFYAAVGGEKNPMFSNADASCMVFHPAVSVMLLSHSHYGMFTSKPIADARVTSGVLLCLALDSRAAVDKMVADAQAAGGVPDPLPVQDFPFMYGRGFEDPDGHTWGITWLDIEAMRAAQTPA